MVVNNTRKIDKRMSALGAWDEAETVHENPRFFVALMKVTKPQVMFMVVVNSVSNLHPQYRYCHIDVRIDLPVPVVCVEETEPSLLDVLQPRLLCAF